MTSYDKFAWYYDRLTENVDHDSIGRQIDTLVDRFDGKKGVLVELGCGTGSVCEVMSGLGYDVIGIDRSQEMLSQAWNKKFESGHDIQYVCQDMTHLQLYGNADVVISVLDCINHLPDKQAVKSTFDRVSMYTEQGGLFIFDVNTIYKHRYVLADNSFIYDLDGLFCTWQNEYNEQDDSVEIFLDFFEENEDGTYERYQENFREIALSEQEIETMLADSGFEVLAKYDDYTEKPVTEKTQRIVYVARKLKR